MTENLRQREPREECPEFLAFVRRKPCAACGAPAPVQAAHLRVGNPAAGKRSIGIAEKPSDRWANPLCAGCHLDAPDSQHRTGDELAFWARVGIDPFVNANRLWRQFCRRKGRDPELREAVTKRAARLKRRRGKREKSSPLRGTHPPTKAKVSRPIRGGGFTRPPAGIKRKWPSRPFNRENRDGAPRR